VGSIQRPNTPELRTPYHQERLPRLRRRQLNPPYIPHRNLQTKPNTDADRYQGTITAADGAAVGLGLGDGGEQPALGVWRRA
jgi:hypothetical protein